MADRRGRRIRSFNLEPGSLLAGKYEVLSLLGKGWEGEVYHVRERHVGVDRAAKLFLPHRNLRDRAARFHARKLHRLRHCPILIQYLTRETVEFEGRPVTCLVSEYVEGEILSRFCRRQPGRRLSVFEALHLTRALAAGVEAIHDSGEYHGDLHDDNVIVRRRGISFDVKLVDMYNWGASKAENVREDVYGLVRILYDVLGGASRYARHPSEIKWICAGLKRTLIAQRFRTAGCLRRHLETMNWDE